MAPGLSFTFHYAGHVLGAAMVLMTAGHLTALYTGEDRERPRWRLQPPFPSKSNHSFPAVPLAGFLSP